MSGLPSQSSVAPRDWVQRYLDLLQVDHPEPSLTALTRLTRAHVATVPFENITSIMRRASHGDAPVERLDLDRVLRAWEERRSGGVCFEVAPMFDRLLTGLGYRTHTVAGQISFPGSHQANLVELDQQQYLVDVGNGSPFPEPIALTEAVEVRHAGLAYRFRPDTVPDTWVQDRRIDDAWTPFCHYLLLPGEPEIRESAYQRHHTPGVSWVVDSLVLARATEEEVWSLRGDELRHFTVAGKTVERISDAGGFTRVAAQIFGLPKLPIESARAVLQRRKLSG